MAEQGGGVGSPIVGSAALSRQVFKEMAKQELHLSEEGNPVSPLVC